MFKWMERRKSRKEAVKRLNDAMASLVARRVIGVDGSGELLLNDHSERYSFTWR